MRRDCRSANSQGDSSPVRVQPFNLGHLGHGWAQVLEFLAVRLCTVMT